MATSGRRGPRRPQAPQVRRPPADGGPMNVLWRGPLLDPSGYAAGGRAFVRGLGEHGVLLRAEPQAWSARQALSRADRERLIDLAAVELPSVDACVQHAFGRFVQADAPGRARVARTMFETDRIPPDWVEPLNRVDE